jgi:hypothetical protein
MSPLDKFRRHYPSGAHHAPYVQAVSHLNWLSALHPMKGELHWRGPNSISNFHHAGLSTIYDVTGGSLVTVFYPYDIYGLDS